MLHPSAVRATRPSASGVGVTGAGPVARRRPWLACTSAHAADASRAGSTHTTIELRHPSASATGTASSAGSSVPTCSTVMYSVLTRLTRSPK